MSFRLFSLLEMSCSWTSCSHEPGKFLRWGGRGASAAGGESKPKAAGSCSSCSEAFRKFLGLSRTIAATFFVE